MHSVAARNDSLLSVNQSTLTVARCHEHTAGGGGSRVVTVSGEHPQFDRYVNTVLRELFEGTT